MEQQVVNFGYSNCFPYIKEEEIAYQSSAVKAAHQLLHSKNGPGNSYLGWLEKPQSFDVEEIKKIEAAADSIRNSSEVVLIDGIGGSYLGAKAGKRMLKGEFYNLVSKEKRNGPEIYFIGNNMSSRYINGIIDVLADKDFSIIVISKSGTTTEPAIAFRIFKGLLEKKYGKEDAKKRIFVTTDKSKGALKKLSDSEGYETFVVPDDIGGRFSVLTAVGLLPLAVAGIDIRKILQGAAKAQQDFMSDDIAQNQCYQYAAIRNILYRKGKTTEILANYEPDLHYFSEWWKQLFGESEGKEQKGIFPASVDLTTDLHSLGQYIQDGMRNVFETVLFVNKAGRDITIEETEDNVDELNFLAGKTVSYTNSKAYTGTMLAHNDGGVPVMNITIEELNEFTFGYLVYFFEKACAISGYMLGVNPFDQPGVEQYKKNMFALLGKPGYEKQKAILEERLK